MGAQTLFNAIVFVVLGFLLFLTLFLLLVRVLPGHLWRRAVEEDSMPAAVVVAAFVLALGWIVASAVH